MKKVNLLVAVVLATLVYQDNARAGDEAYAAACKNANEYIKGSGWDDLAKLDRDLGSFKTVFIDLQRTIDSEVVPDVPTNISKELQSKLKNESWVVYRREARRLLVAYEDLLNKKDVADKAPKLRRLAYDMHAFYAPELNRAIEARCDAIHKKDNKEGGKKAPKEPCHWSAEIHFESTSRRLPDGNVIYEAEPKFVMCSLTESAPHAPIGCLTKNIFDSKVSDDVNLHVAFNHSRKAAAAAYLSKKTSKAWKVALTHIDPTDGGQIETAEIDEDREEFSYATPKPGKFSFGSQYPNPQASTLQELYTAVCDSSSARVPSTEEERLQANKNAGPVPGSDKITKPKGKDNGGQLQR